MMIDRVRQLDNHMNNDFKEIEHDILPILNKYLSEEWVPIKISSDENSSLDLFFSNGNNIIEFSCLYGENIVERRLPLHIIFSMIYHEDVTSTILLAKEYNDKIRNRVYEISKEIPIKIQLLDIDFLKDWAKKIDEDQNPLQTDYNNKIISLSISFVKEILKNSEYINILEWREVERLVGHLLSGLGYDVEITASGNDGGIDVVIYNEGKKYYIQVKHWKSPNKPGLAHVKEFMQVVLNEGAESGIFLSSSGFRKNSFETLTQIERQKLHIGNQEKIISWVKMYSKIYNGIYLPVKNINDILYKDDIDFNRNE